MVWIKQSCFDDVSILFIDSRREERVEVVALCVTALIPDKLFILPHKIN